MPPPLTLKHMRDLAARRGGACLSRKYENAYTALEWRCAQGHRWTALPSSVRQGHWCKRCADAERRLSPQQIAALAAARGGRCLSTDYVNSQSPMLWECAHRHRWRAIANSIKRGSWCPLCARFRRTNAEREAVRA